MNVKERIRKRISERTRLPGGVSSMAQDFAEFWMRSRKAKTAATWNDFEEWISTTYKKTKPKKNNRERAFSLALSRWIPLWRKKLPPHM